MEFFPNPSIKTHSKPSNNPKITTNIFNFQQNDKSGNKNHQNSSKIKNFFQPTTILFPYLHATHLLQQINKSHTRKPKHKNKKHTIETK